MSVNNSLIRFRQLLKSDLARLVEYANNYEIAKNMTNRFPHPYTIENGKEFIELANKDTPTKIFAITLDDKLIGALGIFPQEDVYCKNAEVGWWLGEPFWRKGITQKLLPELLNYGFRTWDLKRIYAKPFGSNIPSQKVLENCGFKLEGRNVNAIFKNGEFQDECIYAFTNPGN